MFRIRLRVALLPLFVMGWMQTGYAGECDREKYTECKIVPKVVEKEVARMPPQCAHPPACKTCK